MLTMIDIVINGFVFFIGLLITLTTLMSAIRAFLMPRSAPDTMVRYVFAVIRWVFRLRLFFTRSIEQRDWILGYYAPISLLLLLPFWLTTTLLGFMCMNWL